MAADKMTAEQALWQSVMIDRNKVSRVIAELRALGFELRETAVLKSAAATMRKAAHYTSEVGDGINLPAELRELADAVGGEQP